jgi:uncharacterized membrane protein YdjX (TVP38/TMEM64 family)
MQKKIDMKNQSPLLIIVVFTIFPLFSSSFLSFWVLKNQAFLTSLSLTNWLFLSLVLVITSALAMSPPTLLAILMGYFIGFKAIPYLVLINIGAIFTVYLLAKNTNMGWADRYFEHNPKAKAILERIKGQELNVIFFTKLSPVLPFALTNLLFASSGAKLKNIILGGFAGMLPRTLLAVYSGSQAKEIISLLENPNNNLYSKLIIVGLVLVSIAGIWFSLRKKTIDGVQL